MFDGVFCMELNNISTTQTPEVDIVFVHGLSSSADQAWRNSQNDLWPLWVRQMFPLCRVILLNYPASAFFYSQSSRVNIQERARNLADLLPTIGIGKRPTIFICHSLGGVLIKEVLRCCVETSCSLEVVTNTIGIIFLATPHSGSNIATLASILGSSLTKDLSKGSEYLETLKIWFIEHVSTTSISVSSYYETQPYKGVMVVETASADPGCNGCNSIPVDQDHTSICKPNSINSDVFLRIKRDIENAINRINSMSRNLTSINDIIDLPEITNHMYFDIVNFLNREFCENRQKAYIISNPCGGPRPCCMIITKDSSLRNMVSPLVKRWPERFSIQDAILGEFTSSTDNEDNENLLHKSTNYFEVAKTLSEYLTHSSDYTIEIRICAYWDEDGLTKAITTAHGLDLKIRNWCNKALAESKDVEKAKSHNKYLEKLRNLLPKKHKTSDSFLNECVYEGINQIYKKNDFKVKLYDYAEKEFDKSNQYLNCKIENIDYSKDLAILAFEDNNVESEALTLWKKRNKTLQRLSSSTEKLSRLEIGDICTSPIFSEKSLFVESTNESVLFPLIDRITAIKSVIVLSGAETISGDSGSPILDKDGNVAAMIIGRTNQDGKTKILAVSINGDSSSNKKLQHF